jgi:signal transduction histidine kinase
MDSLHINSQNTWSLPSITQQDGYVHAAFPESIQNPPIANMPANHTAESWLGSADFRTWGIRPKLIAVVVIPTIAALLLGGLRMKSALAASASYTRLGSLASVLPQVDGLVDALQDERDLTSAAIIAPSPTLTSSLADARTRVDESVTALRQGLVGVDASHDKTLLNNMRETVAALAGLDKIRSSTNARAAATASNSYTSIIDGLIGINDEVAEQSLSSEVSRRANGLEALTKAKEAASRQRALLFGALHARAFGGAQLTDLAAEQARQQESVATFLGDGNDADQASDQAALSGPSAAAVNAVVSRAIGTQSVNGLGVAAPTWYAESSDVIDRLGLVQAAQVSALTKRIHTLSQSARSSALTSALIICLILGFALLATLLVARSILRPLQRLRAGALDVAYGQLPDTVRRLQDGRADAVPQVAPIMGERTDEIGQVASAFDAVQLEALRLAGEQALMRTNVSKMFVNLSRRSQSLVDRQLRLIDELEAGEQDADQLANLFRLDHLATRMRRTDESLLVLAGADGGRRRSGPVPTIDVLRAATAEVELYERVRIDAEPGRWLAGPVVNDIVHLLAELVENATMFSSPGTPVWLHSRGLGVNGEQMIEIEDHGIGMSADELAAANQRLSTASTLDLSMSRMMGLFVVARLAHRHRIQVQMRSSTGGGVTAMVRLPAELSATPTFIPIAPAAEGAPEPEAAPVSDEQDAPIFFALQSEWFTRRVPSYPAEPGMWSVSAREPVWESPADEGWRAAAALDDPVAPPGLTTAGLPIRVPGRNFVPGSAAVLAPAPSRGETRRDPNQARALSSFQQGIERGRSADPEWQYEDQAARPDDQEIQP